jgi:uncharacterized protein (DUF433 family)
MNRYRDFASGVESAGVRRVAKIELTFNSALDIRCWTGDNEGSLDLMCTNVQNVRISQSDIMQILGHGIYSLPYAAKLTHLKSQRVREWFRGRPDSKSRKSIFQSDYQAVDGHQAISFLDLIELFVAGQLRDRGVSLQTLRKVHDQLKVSLETRHPFCREEILTKSGQVFTLGLDEQGRAEMTEVLSGQRVFPDILLPFLSRIDYDDATEMAKRWRVADLIVIDPAICFGKSVVEGTGIATSILAASYEANDQDAELVADWFRVHPKHVIAALEFERSLVA